MAQIETLRPTEINIKIYRGTDNTLVLTVLQPNGQPKDMSGYAALIPQIRFASASQTDGGTIPAYNPQAQNTTTGTNGPGLGLCEWLAGGVGGQIHVVIPEEDISASPIMRGSRLAGYDGTPAFVGPVTGKFDIQVIGPVNLTTIGGSNAAYQSAQRAVTGSWTIDDEVTKAPH